jgi:hypothetical protein
MYYQEIKNLKLNQNPYKQTSSFPSVIFCLEEDYIHFRGAKWAYVRNYFVDCNQIQFIKRAL